MIGVITSAGLRVLRGLRVRIRIKVRCVRGRVRSVFRVRMEHLEKLPEAA